MAKFVCCIVYNVESTLLNSAVYLVREIAFFFLYFNSAI